MKRSVSGAERECAWSCCLCVFCVGPLCGPPLRWWVFCGVLPSVWPPCGWGPPPVASSFHVASTRVMSRARAPAPAVFRGGNPPRVNLMMNPLALTRYCYYQFCLVSSIQTGGRWGSRILPNNRAIVLYQGGQCRWAGGRVTLKSQPVHNSLEVKEYRVKANEPLGSSSSTPRVNPLR